MDKRNGLGKRIREVRERKHFTREELAEKASVTPYYLGEIEREVKQPSLPVFVRICEALGASVDYLLRDELTAGSRHIATDIEQKLAKLTPQQRIAAETILDAYIDTLA